MRRKAIRNWIVLNFDLNAFECKRCGKTYPNPSNVSFNIYLGILKGFQQDHKNCKKKKK